MILHVISVISFRNLFIYVNNSRHFIYIIICNTHHNFECINNKDKRFFMLADRTPAIRKISQCLSFQNLFCTKFSATCVSASFDRVSRKKNNSWQYSIHILFSTKFSATCVSASFERASQKLFMVITIFLTSERRQSNL